MATTEDLPKRPRRRLAVIRLALATRAAGLERALPRRHPRVRIRTQLVHAGMAHSKRSLWSGRSPQSRARRSIAMGAGMAFLVIVATMVVQSTAVFAGANPNGPHPAAVERTQPNETVIWCREQQVAGNSAAVQSSLCQLALNSSAQRTPHPQCYTPCGPNVTCYASTCTNKDPAQTNCASYASTNQTEFGGYLGYTNYQLYVSNRWAGACAANWTREWINANTTGYLWAAVEYQGCCSGLQYPGQGFCCQEGWYVLPFAGTYQTIWTNMLNGGPGTACTSSDDYSGNNYPYFYTGCF
jgi:hypothetical protein